MKPRIYVETTVVSYLVARPSRDLVVAAHQQITREWWDTRGDRFELYVSQAAVREAGSGNAEAAALRLNAIRDLPRLALTEQAVQLAQAFLNRGALPPKAEEDALHIAMATVHGMDYLMTWNCRHIANAEVQRAIASVCLLFGYAIPVICTPEELMGD
jgi:hypothetical protein